MLTALLSLPALHAASQEDSLHTVVLQEITLTENRNMTAVSGSLTSGLSIDSRQMKTFPKLFGYTDPMRYIQSMAGVSTNGDQSGGLHVQGGESSHNLITASDVPVYGTLNFTGMFSLFNQDHLSNVRNPPRAGRFNPDMHKGAEWPPGQARHPSGLLRPPCAQHL